MLEQEDSRIVKIAKLVLLLMNNTVDKETKIGCIRLDIQNGLITQEDALDLLISLPELEDFIAD